MDDATAASPGLLLKSPRGRAVLRPRSSAAAWPSSAERSSTWPSPASARTSAPACPRCRGWSTAIPSLWRPCCSSVGPWGTGGAVDACSRPAFSSSASRPRCAHSLRQRKCSWAPEPSRASGPWVCSGLRGLLLEAGPGLSVAAVDRPLRVGPGGVEEPCRLVGAGRVGLRAFRRRRDGHRGLVHAQVLPAHGAAESAPDDVVDLPCGDAAERAADVAVAGPAGAHRPAAVQSGVEALQELGVEPRGGECPERRHHVEPDEVLVALARRVLQDRDVEPLLDRLPDRDVGLRLLVLVDLALQPDEHLPRVVVGRDGLAEVARPAVSRSVPA